MGVVLPTTAEGVFDDWNQANRAIEALKFAGFSEDFIDIGAEERHVRHGSPGQEETLKAQNQTFFAWIGGALGLVGGALLVMLLPAVELSVQPLPLAVILGCAFFGYLAGGLVGRNLRFGQRVREHENLTDKRWLVVTVEAGDRYEECVNILREHGARGRAGPLI